MFFPWWGFCSKRFAEFCVSLLDNLSQAKILLPSPSSLSYHVSMLQVNIVLQQLPHHLDVTLLGCRDQRRPAVLRTETTRYSGNCHRTPKASSRRREKRSSKLRVGRPGFCRGGVTYQLVVPDAHGNVMSHQHKSVGREWQNERRRRRRRLQCLMPVFFPWAPVRLV